MLYLYNKQILEVILQQKILRELLDWFFLNKEDGYLFLLSDFGIRLFNIEESIDMELIILRIVY